MRDNGIRNVEAVNRACVTASHEFSSVNLRLQEPAAREATGRQLRVRLKARIRLSPEA